MSETRAKRIARRLGEEGISTSPSSAIATVVDEELIRLLNHAEDTDDKTVGKLGVAAESRRGGLMFRFGFAVGVAATSSVVGAWILFG